MPELPEVETTRQSLMPLLNARVVAVRTSGLRLREPVADNLTTLMGYQLTAVKRQAKYLLLHFARTPNDPDEKVLLIHLGMSGSLGQYPTLTDKRKHDHVIFDFDNGIALHYHDPRRFGMVIWQTSATSYLSKLGIEPLSEAFDGAYLYAQIHKKPRPIHRPIKAVIMDQQIVVGVGNIYATESLFLSHIHPNTPADYLNLEALELLATNIQAILKKAIQVGGTTLKDFSVGQDQTGYFQQTLLAYGRAGEPCVNCHLPLENIKIATRASVFCPTCQPLITTAPKNVSMVAKS